MRLKNTIIHSLKDSMVRLGLIMSLLVMLVYVAYGNYHADGRIYFGYYDKLGSAFMAGQTHLKETPPARFLTLENPYKYGNRRGITFMWDASYYDDHYYLYFGPAPIIFPWIPVYLLTGKRMIDQELCSMLSIMGTVCLIWLTIGLAKRQQFQSLWVVGLVLLVLSFGTWLPLLLRRPLFYEVAIASAYFYTALGILCLWHSIAANASRKLVWKIASGLAFGGAIASRPFYGLAMIIPFWMWIRNSRTRSLSASFNDGFQLTVGWFICIILLAVYNYVRFDSIFETGFKYQLTGRDYVHDSVTNLWNPGNLWNNLYTYLFKPIPASKLIFWDKWFGVSNGDVAYGMIYNGPFCLWALWFLFKLRKNRAWFGEYYHWICGLVLFTISMSAFIIGFYTAVNRYMIDFVPWIMFLAGLGFMQCVQQAKTPLGRKVIIITGAVMAIGTSYIGLANSYCSNSPCKPIFSPVRENTSR